LKAREKQNKANRRKEAADALVIQAFEAAGISFITVGHTKVAVENRPSRTVDYAVLAEHLDPETLAKITKHQADLRRLDALVGTGDVPEEIADKATKKKWSTQVRCYAEGELRNE
jgi:UDP-2,3-diacylglucosamine pyrophosphatase LpxH